MKAGSAFLLRYNYVADVAARRVGLREAHLALAKEASESETGKLLLGGALTPLEEHCTGYLLFESREAAEKFVKLDPYVSGGLVTSTAIFEWSLAAGSLLEKN